MEESIVAMGKLIVLSLEETEQTVYNKIMKIIEDAGICIKGKVNEVHESIEIGEIEIQPDRYKVLKRNQEVSLTNIEFRILYVLALHQGCILSKEQIYNFVWNGSISGMIVISFPMFAV